VNAASSSGNDVMYKDFLLLDKNGLAADKSFLSYRGSRRGDGFKVNTVSDTSSGFKGVWNILPEAGTTGGCVKYNDDVYIQNTFEPANGYLSRTGHEVVTQMKDYAAKSWKITAKSSAGFGCIQYGDPLIIISTQHSGEKGYLGIQSRAEAGMDVVVRDKHALEAAATADDGWNFYAAGCGASPYIHIMTGTLDQCLEQCMAMATCYGFQRSGHSCWLDDDGSQSVSGRVSWSGLAPTTRALATAAAWHCAVKKTAWLGTKQHQAAWKSAYVEGTVDLSWKLIKSMYYKRAQGSSSCPPGDRIATRADCLRAFEALGLTPSFGNRPIWVGQATNNVGGCSVAASPSEGRWNTISAAGPKDHNISPICREQRSQATSSFERMLRGAMKKSAMISWVKNQPPISL